MDIRLSIMTIMNVIELEVVSNGIRSFEFRPNLLIQISFH